MAIFGVDVIEDKSLNVFVYKMNKKLSSPDLFENPFKGFIKNQKYKNKPYLFIYLDLIWFNPFYPALFLTTALLIANLFKWHWTYFLTVPLWMGAFMFTNIFSKLAIYFSLRKAGYKKKIKFITDTELLLRLSNWHEKI